MKIRILPLDEALGLRLSHDLTQIVPETGYKGPRFKKGHVVTEEDVPTLRTMGREHLSIIEISEDEVHEDEAALRLSEVLAGEGMEVKGPSEGKCVLVACRDGLLIFDEDMVNRVNDDPEWILATLPPKVPVHKGEQVAAFRIRPLVVQEEQVARAEKAGRSINVLPFLPLKVGLVTTGREIADGRIKDTFRPRMERKAERFGGTLLGQRIVADDKDEICRSISTFLEEGAELIICTGGMSVDADDLTPAAISDVSDKVLFHGVPSLPGSMLMLGVKGRAAIVGAPACVVHDEWTTLDLLLQQLFAGLIPAIREIRRWGVGGLCRRCEVCIYPNCAFAQRP